MINLILVLFSSFSWAQLCTGSLGDPIVNIDFGNGSATHAGSLPAGTTNYTYSSADFPIDGSYTVENSTAGSGSVWWSTTDHTGNSGGYMMVVNASISKTNYFYKSTITGLCPGTLYEFAAWIMNLLRSQDKSPPDITFMIEKTDGTLLNSYTTGPVALQSSPVWRQFGLYFTTPANVSSVIIVMRNNSSGGAPANDIALDDITFRPCGPEVTAWISGSNATSDTLCAGSGDVILLQGSVSSGFVNPQSQWQELINGTWQDISGATSLTWQESLDLMTYGIHQFRLATGDGDNISSSPCRIVSNLITVKVESAPLAKFGIVTPVICSNQAVQFFDSTQTSVPLTFQWDFGDGTTSGEKDPTHFYQQSGNYNASLIVTTPIGCADTAILNITINILPVPGAKFTASPTDTSIYHPTITFTDESSDAVNCTINWGDGIITDCNTIQHDYTEPGTYIVMEIVENAANCHDTAYATVVIRAEYRFYLPNAFTPNGDGLNDVFLPMLYGVYDYVFRVFNRWGELLFETTNPEQGWDGQYNGKKCPSGIYVYNISFLEKVTNSIKKTSGTFTLLP